MQGSPPLLGTILKESGTANAVAACTIPAPSLNMMVLFSLGCDAGGTPRVLVNYQDENNYHFVEFSGGMISLGTMQGGSVTIHGTKTFDCGKLEVYRLCFNEFGVLLFRFSTFLFWECVTPFADGRKAGFGNGGSGPTTFGDFQLEDLKVNDAACEDCMCTCGGHCVPDHLTATIRNISGCDAIDGTQVTLYANTDSLASQCGAGVMWCPEGGYQCQEDAWFCNNCVFSFWLFCYVKVPEDWGDESACQRWRMWNLNAYPCALGCSDGGEYGNCTSSSSSSSDYLRYCKPDPDSCGCDPLYLKFRTFQDGCPYGQDCCCTPSGGTFYVEITE